MSEYSPPYIYLGLYEDEEWAERYYSFSEWEVAQIKQMRDRRLQMEAELATLYRRHQQIAEASAP